MGVNMIKKKTVMRAVSLFNKTCGEQIGDKICGEQITVLIFIRLENGAICLDRT